MVRSFKVSLARPTVGVCAQQMCCSSCVMKQKLFFSSDNRNQRRRQWSKERELLLLLLPLIKEVELRVLRERRRVEQTELDFEGAFIITGLCCRVMRSYSYCLYNTLSVSYSIRLLAIGIYINSGGFCWRRFFFFLFYTHFHIQWPLDDDFWSLCWLILQLCDYISFCIEATTNKQRLSRIIFTFLLYLWLARSLWLFVYIYLLETTTIPFAYTALLLLLPSYSIFWLFS